jgi:pyruvate formate lyase activating enzyme
VEAGVWVEVTTLVIPGVNDDEETLRDIARRIAAELGAGTPWHLSAYFPAYKFRAPPTPLRTLERAWEWGREVGLEYVYLGNVFAHQLENTYCPQCGTLLVERRGLSVGRNRLREGYCPDCGREIPGRF